MQSNEPLHEQTPIHFSIGLTKKVGFEVYCKMDAYQQGASFKIRGIGLLCQRLAAKGVKEFVSSSGGSAGYAVAFSGNRLNVPVHVFVPEPTSEEARTAIRNEGATVHVGGAAWDDAHEAATKYVESKNGEAYLVHPFDNPVLWEGHKTIIEESVTQWKPKEAPDCIVVAVGGGGLLCGVLDGLKEAPTHWNKIPVVCAETTGASSFKAAFDAGHIVRLDKVDTIATSLGTRAVTSKLEEWFGQHELIPCTVTDKETVAACRAVARLHRVLIEAACGAAVAALPQVNKLLRSPPKRVLVIVCGGVGAKPYLKEEAGEAEEFWA